MSARSSRNSVLSQKLESVVKSRGSSQGGSVRGGGSFIGTEHDPPELKKSEIAAKRDEKGPAGGRKSPQPIAEGMEPVAEGMERGKDDLKAKGGVEGDDIAAESSGVEDLKVEASTEDEASSPKKKYIPGAPRPAKGALKGSRAKAVKSLGPTSLALGIKFGGGAEDDATPPPVRGAAGMAMRRFDSVGAKGERVAYRGPTAPGIR